jgi:hypothetical protein
MEDVEDQQPRSGWKKAADLALGCVGALIAFVYPMGAIASAPHLIYRFRNGPAALLLIPLFLSLSGAFIVANVMRPGKDYCLTGIPLILIALVEAAAAVFFLVRAYFFAA